MQDWVQYLWSQLSLRLPSSSSVSPDAKKRRQIVKDELHFERNVSNCVASKEQLMDREPRQTERKTIMRRAIEQCGATRRAPEEQRQRRQEKVRPLLGKLKRLEFQTSMAVLGYTGNTNKLWEELGLKKKQSVRPQGSAE
eukprot:g27256.t1